MRVASLNVNGIRASVRRGLLNWLAESSSELFCLQEIRATHAQLPLRELQELGFESTWNLGTRPGYSGVGILSRLPFEQAGSELADLATANEGRFLAVRLGATVVACCYVPNGNRGPQRLTVKLQHLRALRNWAERQLAAGGKLLLAGDFNLAAQRIDVDRPTHPTGFLPVEREAFAALLELGLVDCFRTLHPGEPGHYTWWGNRPGDAERNVGWRFDYLLASLSLAAELETAWHERQPELSDHCAVVAEFADRGEHIQRNELSTGRSS